MEGMDEFRVGNYVYRNSFRRNRLILCGKSIFYPFSSPFWDKKRAWDLEWVLEGRYQISEPSNEFLVPKNLLVPIVGWKRSFVHDNRYYTQYPEFSRFSVSPLEKKWEVCPTHQYFSWEHLKPFRGHPGVPKPTFRILQYWWGTCGPSGSWTTVFICIFIYRKNAKPRN